MSRVRSPAAAENVNLIWRLCQGKKRSRVRGGKDVLLERRKAVLVMGTSTVFRGPEKERVRARGR